MTYQALMTPLNNLKYRGCSVIQPLLLAARWHYFTFSDAWIQADVVKPRDHSLTNQRSTCILQPLTTPKKKELFLLLSLQVLCALSCLFCLSLSSFTKYKPPLLLLLLSLSLQSFSDTLPIPSHSPLPFNFLLPSLYFHSLPLHSLPLTFSFSLLLSCRKQDHILMLYSKLNTTQHVLRLLSKMAQQTAACVATDFKSVCFKDFLRQLKGYLSHDLSSSPEGFNMYVICKLTISGVQRDALQLLIS